MNDDERRLWVLNDACLYNSYKYSRMGLYAYVRENRDALTKFIEEKIA